jgi:hypothetical protein
MENRIVAIHQPNFFPWLGFFDKILRSDVFVLLDHVQFPKKGGNWMNRVQIAMNGRANWITVPVDRAFHGTRSILEIQMDNRTNWQNKMLKTIAQYYASAPCFKDTMGVIERLIHHPTSFLADFNVEGIRSICKEMGLSCSHVVPSSSLHVQEAPMNFSLPLQKKLNCNAYMCGGGADGYQNEGLFQQAGVKPFISIIGIPCIRSGIPRNLFPGLVDH